MDVPATRSLMRRWWKVVDEWVAADGPVDIGFMTDAAAAGIRTPGGWPHYLTSTRVVDKATRDRWADLDAAIAEAEQEER